MSSAEVLEHSSLAAAAPDWLLLTKITPPPPRPGLVPRPRLQVRLERGVRGPLTVVAAPAGFGKTTLLVEWQASAAAVPPVAWFSLDSADNDEVRFWSYVLVALQHARPGLGEAALGVLRSPHTPPIETVLARLVHDLVELDEDVVLVLDDYQVIESEAIHRALESLLERLPPRAHVVMLSRAEPPLALARLRVRGQLVELRADDLRFLPDEATAFLSDTMRLDLPERASADLERVTEGWIAGLQLAALALDGRTNPDEFIESFAGSHRFVLDYLIEEVLQRQPESVQRFLLRTSVLQRLSGPLCEAVAEQLGAGATLEYLDRANLFLVPLDSERRWYRYHHLFAHALRHRLELTEPDAVTELHRRAAEWYAGAGFVDEAVGHLLAAGEQRDLDRAAELVEGVVVALIGIGEVATLLGLIAKLPSYVVQERPRLLLGEAWAFLVGRQYRLMKVRVEAAERVLASRHDISEVVQEELRWEVIALSCYLAQVRGDLPAAIAIGEEARTRPAENLQWRWGSALMALGTAYRLVGRTAEAAEAFSTVADIGEQTSNAIMAAYALIELGYIHQAHAQLEQAASTFRRIVRVAESGRISPLTLAALGHLGLGELYREWDDLATSEQHLSQAVVEASRGGLSGSLLWGHAYLALVQHARGEVELAQATLNRGAEYLEEGDAYGAGCIRTIDAMLRLGSGDLDAAARWAGSAQPPSPSEVATISVGRRDIEYVAFARVWLAEAAAGRGGDRLQLAHDLIQRMLEPAEATRRTGRVIELLALQAVALDLGGDRQAALHQLARALELAEPHRYRRTFLELGTPMVRLLGALRRSHASGPSAAYVRSLLEGFGVVSSVTDNNTLSPRERDVVRLMALGASNAHIAEELVVSIATVKTHINGVFRKLGAANRVEALLRARERGLI